MKDFYLAVFFIVNGLIAKAQHGGDLYYSGDWNGDKKSNIAVRRGATMYYDINKDGKADGIQSYGNGELVINNIKDEYLIGDWDGDGKDNIAVRRDNQILMDYNFDGIADKTFKYGNGNSENAYLVGDWDGDGKDNIAVRRDNQILMDYNFDGIADKTFKYGNGNSENAYLVGDWDGDGKDNIAVRRDNQILMDYNFDGIADKTFKYGNGNSENAYLVGDWDGDGKDNIAVLRNITLFMDTDFNQEHNITQDYGNGMTINKEGGNFFNWIGSALSDGLGGIFKGIGSVIDFMDKSNAGWVNNNTTTLPENLPASAYISNDFNGRSEYKSIHCKDYYFKNSNSTKKIIVKVKYNGSIFDEDCSSNHKGEIVTKIIYPKSQELFYVNIGGHPDVISAIFEK